MLLWISFALLAAAVATALLRAPPGVDALPSHDPDLAVYRDQIAEIETEAEHGAIGPSEAASARTEIARRLLKQAAAAKAGPAAPRAATAPAETVLLAGALAVPILSLALYVGYGSPSLPGRPLAARLAEPVDPGSPTDMIAKVEARLREKPDDGQGWAVIAPVYLAQGRATEAAQAYARAISLVGETPERLAGFAKASVIVNNGIVNEPARKAYERLQALDPSRLEAEFWLAVYDEQNGRPDAAAAVYIRLLARAAPDAPWRKTVEERLAAVTGKAAPPSSSAPNTALAPPELARPSAGPDASRAGPTPAEFVAAAQKLAPEMREQMIGGRMVTKARDAVKANPKDVAAWSRIVTGLTALGKSGEAQTALKEARQSVLGDSAALAELDALAKNLGLS